MKKFFLCLLAIGGVVFTVSAQTNTFPTSGNVGIGTTSPSSKLEVLGVAGASKNLRLTHPHDRIANGVNDGLSIERTEIQSLEFFYSASSVTGVIGKIATVNYNTEGTGWYDFDTRRDAGLSFFTSNSGTLSERLTIKHNGYVGIGTVNPDFRLTVNGKIKAEEVQVVVNVPADYVFEEDYYLRPLQEVETYIKANKHLPGIPSADELKEQGWQIGEMNNLLLEKVEELTLYMIELKKENEEMKKELESVKNLIGKSK